MWKNIGNRGFLFFQHQNFLFYYIHKNQKGHIIILYIVSKSPILHATSLTIVVCVCFFVIAQTIGINDEMKTFKVGTQRIACILDFLLTNHSSRKRKQTNAFASHRKHVPSIVCMRMQISGKKTTDKKTNAVK